MTGAEHEEQQDVVVDLIDDAVVARSDPPLACSAHEPGGGRRVRVESQELDGSLHPAPCLGV
jgi:hypothetical protein